MHLLSLKMLCKTTGLLQLLAYYRAWILQHLLFPGVERKSSSISLKEKSPFVFSFVFFTVQILVKIKNLWCKIMAA